MTHTIRLLVILSTLVLFMSCDDEHLQPEDLPAEAQNFIATHYEGTRSFVEKDRSLGKVVYEVDLITGVELEFDKNGACTSVGGNVKEVPSVLIHTKIYDYIANLYPNATIQEWELEKKHQEVELSCHVELVFDLDGEFLYGRTDH